MISDQHHFMNRPYKYVLIGINLLGFLVYAANAQTQILDGTGVPLNVQNQLLSTLAPVIYHDQPDDKPPLPIDWYVRHCQLIWEDAPFGTNSNIGNTGDQPLTISYALGLINLQHSQGFNYHYKLHFRGPS